MIRKFLTIFTIIMLLLPAAIAQEGETAPPEPTPTETQPTEPAQEPQPSPEPAPQEPIPVTEPQPSEPLPPAECPSIEADMQKCREGRGIPKADVDSRGCQYLRECLPFGAEQPGTPTGICPQFYFDNIQACKSKGGMPRTERDDKGCEKLVGCDFGGQPGTPTGPSQPREGCWVGEQRVPCPGEMAPDCQPIFNPSTGMTEVRCQQRQQTCPPYPEDAVRKCKESNGQVQEFKDPSGCPRIECFYGESGTSGNFEGKCPPFEEIEMIRKKCEEQKMRFTVFQEFGCKVARCEGGEGLMPGQECHKLGPGLEMTIKNLCSQQGAYIIQEFDEKGCVYPRCSIKIEEIEQLLPERLEQPMAQKGEFCKKDVPKEAYERCEAEGGKLMVNNNEQGCIVFSKCVRRGDSRDVEYEFVDEVPPATKLVEIAFRLEEIKIQFDRLARKANSIADYYRSVGDDANAKKFEAVAGMFESAKRKIEEMGLKMREKVRNLTPEDIMDFKHDLKYISEVIMEDVAYVMLGGVEATAGEYIRPEAIEEVKETGKFVNCKRDFRCFEDALRICSPSSSIPEEGITVEINGLAGGNCIIKAVKQTPEGEASMKCAYPDYAFGDLSKEKLLPYCEGELRDLMYGKSGEQMPSTEKAEIGGGEGLMGCEKVELGMNKRGVCNNGCCEENYGESYNSCPRDCMSPEERMREEVPFERRIPEGYQMPAGGGYQGGEMMGCEKVNRGINPKGVCGNGCCEENYGESYNSCPQDCTAPKGQQYEKEYKAPIEEQATPEMPFGQRPQEENGFMGQVIRQITGRKG